ATIGDRVWLDTNGNGLQDAGENGLADIAVGLVGLTGPGDSVSLNTTTSITGSYIFTNLVPGVYTVTVTATDPYTFTYANITEVSGATDANDSDANRLTGVMASTVITSGQVDLTWDAGLVEPVSLGNFVWHDVDADGIQDVGEPGIPGVTVTLTGAGRDRTFGNGDDTTLITTTTATGFYTFTDLLPGLYRVTVTRPDGYDRFSV
ncbi:SdrD B-like domain-containing protein, partial [Candidatus Chloroploca asiatica]|uniref:SdrD B-like domain-containing protein n=1 Tax=Candidatus Chloroploca asiatica TaxID=1506545 RepID=UPI00248261DA